MGSAHATTLADGKIRGMRLAAICDTDSEKRHWARETFPDVPVFPSTEELFSNSESEVALIATPHYFHAPIACEAFQHGLHVLTEKPIAVSVTQADAMIAAANKAGTAFGIMFNQRTNSLYRKARTLVSEGTLGELRRIVWIITNWYRTQAYYDSGNWRATWAGEGGGVLLNQAPHNLDLWQWICGMPKTVFARCTEGKYHRIETEDDAEIFASYNNGASGIFITSTGDCPGTNRLEITGSRGTLLLEKKTLTITQLTVPEEEFRFSCPNSFGLPERTIQVFQEEDGPEGHQAILQNFAEHIHRGIPLIAPGQEGIHALELSNAAYLSSWTGMPVSFPFDQKEFNRRLEEKKKQSSFISTFKNRVPEGKISDRWSVHW